MRYSWPGNVRELRNLIERIVIMNPAVSKLERKHLPTLVYRESGRRTWAISPACTRPAPPTNATTS